MSWQESLFAFFLVDFQRSSGLHVQAFFANLALFYGLTSWLARWKLAGIESLFLTFWDGDNIALYPSTGQNGRNGMWN